MDLTRDIDSYKRRLNKIAPRVDPPKLKMNIYSEIEWKLACPIKNPKDYDYKQSPWELNLVIEEKRPLSK